MEITFPPGDECNSLTKENYEIKMKFICDESLPLGVFSPIYESFNISEKICKNNLEIRTANGKLKINKKKIFLATLLNLNKKIYLIIACSITNHFPLLVFLQRYKIFLGVVMIIGGFFMLILGTKFVQVTFVITLGSIFVQFALMLYESFHIEDTNPDYIWIFLGIGFCLGVGIAYFALSVITLVKLSIGGYLGYIFSAIVYQFVLRYIHLSSPEVLYWITVLLCIIIGCFLITILVKEVMIVATSFIGSYVVIKGISLYAGRFPNEQVIFEMLKNEEYDQLADVNNFANFFFTFLFSRYFLLLLFCI